MINNMLKPKTKRLKYIKAWAVIFTWLVVSIVIGGVIGSLVFFLTSKLPNQSLESLLVSIVSYGAVVLVLVVVINKLWKEKDTLKALGMRGSITWKGVIWAAVGCGVYFLASWALILLLSKIFHGFDPNAIKLYDRSQINSGYDITIGLFQVAVFDTGR